MNPGQNLITKFFKESNENENVKVINIVSTYENKIRNPDDNIWTKDISSKSGGKLAMGNPGDNYQSKTDRTGDLNTNKIMGNPIDNCMSRKVRKGDLTSNIVDKGTISFGAKDNLDDQSVRGKSETKEVIYNRDRCEQD